MAARHAPDTLSSEALELWFARGRRLWWKRWRLVIIPLALLLQLNGAFFLLDHGLGWATASFMHGHGYDQLPEPLREAVMPVVLLYNEWMYSKYYPAGRVWSAVNKVKDYTPLFALAFVLTLLPVLEVPEEFTLAVSRSELAQMRRRLARRWFSSIVRSIALLALFTSSISIFYRLAWQYGGVYTIALPLAVLTNFVLAYAAIEALVLVFGMEVERESKRQRVLAVLLLFALVPLGASLAVITQRMLGIPLKPHQPLSVMLVLLAFGLLAAVILRRRNAPTRGTRRAGP